MNYKFLLFCCSWEIDAVEGSRIVCEGFLPNTLEGCEVFNASLKKALLASNDDEVRNIMCDWIEGMTRPMPTPLLPNIFTSRLGTTEKE